MVHQLQEGLAGAINETIESHNLLVNVSNAVANARAKQDKNHQTSVNLYHE